MLIKDGNIMIGRRQARVFVQNRFAGILGEIDEGYIFSYEDEYYKSADAIPVSLTLPLDKREYLSRTLFSFFDGLIPEGWMLGMVIKNWKLDPRDRFGILLAACADPVGDVRIEAADTEVGE